jgi:hypothetical protein
VREIVSDQLPASSDRVAASRGDGRGADAGRGHHGVKLMSHEEYSRWLRGLEASESASPARPKPRRPIVHQSWMSRLVLWARRGAFHLATHAAPVGDGVVMTLACGGATGYGLEVNTYYGMRNRRKPLCRRCVKILAAAGERGRIGRAVTIGQKRRR